MKSVSTFSFAIPAIVSCGALLLSCGNDGGGAGADGGNSGVDAAPGDSPCGFEDRYLPYQVGYQWTYKVTDLAVPGSANKSQTLTAETDPDFGEVIVQTTAKSTGTTVSALKRVGDAVVRLRQEDFDELNVLERTTLYDPGQTRLDEASDRLVVDAEWDDIYTISVDKVGGTPFSGSRTDHWKVLGVDVDCSSPLGDFKCLHLQKVRTAGGVSDKQFFFAKGIGKVKEVNANQIEELIGCEVQ